jgi:hypothetical protein
MNAQAFDNWSWWWIYSSGRGQTADCASAGAEDLARGNGATGRSGDKEASGSGIAGRADSGETTQLLRQGLSVPADYRGVDLRDEALGLASRGGSCVDEEQSRGGSCVVEEQTVRPSMLGAGFKARASMADMGGETAEQHASNAAQRASGEGSRNGGAQRERRWAEAEESDALNPTSDVVERWVTAAGAFWEDGGSSIHVERGDRGGEMEGGVEDRWGEWLGTFWADSPGHNNVVLPGQGAGGGGAGGGDRGPEGGLAEGWAAGERGCKEAGQRDSVDVATPDGVRQVIAAYQRPLSLAYSPAVTSKAREQPASGRTTPPAAAATLQESPAGTQELHPGARAGDLPLRAQERGRERERELCAETWRMIAARRLVAVCALLFGKWRAISRRSAHTLQQLVALQQVPSRLLVRVLSCSRHTFRDELLRRSTLSSSPQTPNPQPSTLSTKH